MNGFAWLRSISLYPKIYWKNRLGKGFVAAGMKESRGDLLFNWRSFCPKQSSEWADFFALSPFTPREYVTLQDAPATIKTPLVFYQQSLRCIPELPVWIETLERALNAIQLGSCSKIVTARRVDIECKETIDPLALCEALNEEGQTVFLFQPTPFSAFLGASPETLYQRVGRTITCDSLAGTCLKGKEHILQKKNIQREFFLVQEHLLDILTPLCISSPLSNAQQVRSTPTLSHLSSSISGTLKESVTDDDLLSALHPTAAVGGLPREAALDFLSTEPFTRGLYAAPIGWHTPQEAEFAVAIRSCLIQGSRASLFAGTGIVEGSDPLLEWEESEHKLASWKQFFLPQIKKCER